MRILVTGSQLWTDERLICEALDRFRSRSPKAPRPEHILVSGACPRGADRICEGYATEVGWVVERHPAEWDLYGRRAGYIRNAEMVNLGADICLAFILNKSKGATMTARLAEESGIETHIWWINDSEQQRFLT